MSTKTIPPYDVITYLIKPPFAGRHFGAKAIVGVSYRTRADDPWSKEFWGRTEEEAIAEVQRAIENWSKS